MSDRKITKVALVDMGDLAASLGVSRARFAETSLALFLTATDALKAWFGDPRS